MLPKTKRYVKYLGYKILMNKSEITSKINKIPLILILGFYQILFVPTFGTYTQVAKMNNP